MVVLSLYQFRYITRYLRSIRSSYMIPKRRFHNYETAVDDFEVISMMGLTTKHLGTLTQPATYAKWNWPQRVKSVHPAKNNSIGINSGNSSKWYDSTDICILCPRSLPPISSIANWVVLYLTCREWLTTDIRCPYLIEPSRWSCLLNTFYTKDVISQTIFSYAFSWMKYLYFD